MIGVDIRGRIADNFLEDPHDPRPALANRNYQQKQTSEMNVAEAGTPDNWRRYENALTSLRRALAFGYQTYLPFVMPVRERIRLAAEREDPNTPVDQGEGRYYGFGQTGPDASYAAAPRGAVEPWVWEGIDGLYQGAYPLGYQPDLSEPAPWMRNGLYG